MFYINKSSLQFNNIENIISYDLLFNGLTNCEKCNLGDNFLHDIFFIQFLIIQI